MCFSMLQYEVNPNELESGTFIMPSCHVLLMHIGLGKCTKSFTK